MKRFRKKEAAKKLKQLVNLDELKNTENKLIGEPTDYSDINNWLYVDFDSNHEVDVFYLYPTVIDEENEDDESFKITPICDEMKAGAFNLLQKQAGCFGNYSNLFAPYYRQFSTDVLTRYGNDENKILDIFRNSEVYTDVYTAIDAYFRYLNQNRPFILASHSQGSMIMKIILKEYMKDHPDIYKRMIAAYVIGYGITKEFMEANPHLKFAEGAKDTGVIISWNTEGPNAKKDSKLLFPNSISINPLNWKRDTTPASTKENLGSYYFSALTNHYMIVPGLADATIDNKRGSIICRTYDEYMDFDLFGDKSLHGEDWGLYIENIKQNVYDRMASYLGHYPKVGAPLDYSDELNWIYCEDEPKHAVDTFYIYPTVVLSNNGKISSILSSEHINTAEVMYNRNVKMFSDFSNLYAPLYHQITFEGASTCNNPEMFCDLVRRHKALTEIYDALDYYFENYNNGRPFMFVSHSQGSAIVRLILSEYMKDHPDYLKRMIAAYAIGYNFSKEFFEANPELKFAKGETDTNVIISWNTEGPNATKESLVVGENGYCINPLNWRTDETPASADENLGSLVENEVTGALKIIPKYADAYIDIKRGSLVCTTITDYLDIIDNFGDRSLHTEDINLYFMNMYENAKKRIDAYLKDNK